jgi:hypothetical protein
MSPLLRGLVVGLIQLALVASLGAKLLWDRSTLPHVWVRAAPFDPELPLRGRYVRLRVYLEERDIQGLPEAAPGANPPVLSSPIALEVSNGRLGAILLPPGTMPYSSSDMHLQRASAANVAKFVLDREVAFFIPENVADPSRRAAGEQLWLEATIPPKGPPRPIRLGVQTADGPIVPLELN